MVATDRKHSTPPDISEKDIIDAMKAVQGYIDITPGDFRQIYQIAYTMAIKRLLTTIKAADLMTEPVLRVEQTMSLAQVADLLAGNHISGAPVVDNKQQIVGVVSEKDFFNLMGLGGHSSFMQIATHCLHDKSCMIDNLRGRIVADIMTTPPIIGTPEMTVSAISTIFAERMFNRLPIVDGQGQIIGIVTRTDLAHAYHVFGEDW